MTPSALDSAHATRPDGQSEPALRREVGWFGATMMGLGSIVGTGVFVSIGIAAGVAGPAVVLAIAVAALVATCNGLSSAQLAANHPVSGGAYEYGYRWLNSSLGFTAGWMFLCAKSASAATAALGFAGYLLRLLGHDQPTVLVPLALAAVLLLTALALTGIKRSNTTNIVLVIAAVGALLAFILVGAPSAWANGAKNLVPFFSNPAQPDAPLPGFLQACALMFVAYTGYGRIATLAEEVRAPRRVIPLAIVVTLCVSMALYFAVGLIGVAAVGAPAFAPRPHQNAAPLELVALSFATPGVSTIVAIGAMVAMLGVLLNLILGLSRVVLAMGRRRDLPGRFASVSAASGTPWPAVLLVGVIIAGLVAIGNVKTTWSFSAFTVLIYYAITNLAALRLKPDERLYPPGFAWLGLSSCLFLAFWVDASIWLAGLGVIACGLLWHEVARRVARPNPTR